MDSAMSPPRLAARDYYEAFDSLSDAIVCVGGSHKITHINPAAQKLFETDAAYAVGRRFDTVLPQSFLRDHQRLYLRGFLERNAPHMAGRVFRLKLLTRNGQLFPATVSISLAHPGDGDIFVFLIRRRLSSSFLPITEYATDFLGTSLSTICHEIRNPLVPIGGFARRVSQDPNISQASREMLDIVQQEVSRLERLVSDLNDLSKISNYHFTYTDCSLLLKYAAELMNEQAKEEGKTIVFYKSGAIPRLWADKDKLNQVVINILRNALQASPAGSRVVINFHTALRPGYVTISIKDQGKGISPEDLPQIFKPFFTTTKGGTGLGLSMARRIVEDHGGFMALKSELGRGTEAMVYLPIPSPPEMPDQCPDEPQVSEN
jgi:PAS domain S-box-containing protein